GLALFVSPQLFHWLQKPLQGVLPQGAHFIVTTPFESYTAYFKIAMVAGILLGSPLIFYFFWSFIRPGLEKKERRGIVPIALACGFLFIGGALFGYFLVFPTGFRFVTGILEGTGIVFYPKMSDYLSFSLRLLLAFGIIFELPLFLLILGKMRLVNVQRLRAGRKYIIVGIFLVAGILTPGPDVLSQVLMALPLLVLFEVGVILVRIFGPKPVLSPADPLPAPR
ncbi:MAG TPA: twin-arginine translocase subunit TatC, partial [Deltaproteobacteria bacterium]|nr:twin-arginine translocase subunit TatC [Deltaproteobacteria bacterium]